MVLDMGGHEALEKSPQDVTDTSTRIPVCALHCGLLWQGEAISYIEEKEQVYVEWMTAVHYGDYTNAPINFRPPGFVKLENLVKNCELATERLRLHAENPRVNALTRFGKAYLESFHEDWLPGPSLS
jgi:hypothetical protein